MNVKKFLCLSLLGYWYLLVAAQTAIVTRNVNLRPDASTDNNPIEKLVPPASVRLLKPQSRNGFVLVSVPDGRQGWVWSKNIQVQEVTPPPSPTSAATGTQGGVPSPLLAQGHPVDWWFVFKFNSAAFPGCVAGATRACLFGGDVQPFTSFSQQFAFASSDSKTLQAGSVCAGDTTEDPIGATFDEIYNGTFNYVVWNDQFYQAPKISGCSDSCSAPWGHSKGMIAWNDAGDGLVLQVTTPDWPGSGSKHSPRQDEGNTLGCTKKDNDIKVSQHFFALRLNKGDVIAVLTALQNASVVTDTQNPQIVKNGGPDDIQVAVRKLGVKVNNQTVLHSTLSTGVQLISKPSALHVPPWQMVSAILDGVSLRTATWWTNPQIFTTTVTSTISCWDPSLGNPGAVEIATSGTFGGKMFGLKGGPGPDFNHAKIGVSTSGTHHYAIFGDMNQQGAISGNCGSSQNGRGGLFFVIDDAELSNSVKELISGDTAPTHP
jgi:hypothetical protein